MIKVAAAPVLPPTVVSSQPEKESFWDTFEHVLLFISLYVYAISLTLMLHRFIDAGFPENYSSRSFYHPGMIDKNLVRGYMASLIVSFPLFSFFFLRVKERVLKYPSLIHLRSRKQLIYMTMVVAFVIVLLNVISIVISFLDGNTNLNFFFHFLATVTVASIIFAYLLNEVKSERRAYA